MAKKVNTDQYIAGVNAKLRRINELNKDLTKVIFSIHSEHAQSIFGDGLDGTSYSSKPTLAGGNVFGNRNRFGNSNYTFATKAGSDKFFGDTDGEWRRVNTPRGPRNLKLIPGGYKAIRQADGRRVDKVDLVHTGLMAKDFRSSLTKTKTGWVVGVRKKENVGKLNGAKDRYGKKLEVPDSIVAKYRPRLGQIMARFLTL
jgi:hypothetical protein